MKRFERRTSKFVDSFLRNFKADLNRQLKNLSEEEVIIPTTEVLATGNTLFAIELTIPDSLGNKKFVSRY